MPQSIQELLKDHAADFGDIFDFTLTDRNTLVLDFTAGNKAITRAIIKDAREQEKYVFDLLEQRGSKVGVGGYMEERVLYQRSELFSGQGAERYIHLGIDLWIAAHTPIYAPLDGTVYSVKNNQGLGDYGPTLFLQHELGAIPFYTLYGHLTEGSIRDIQVGDSIRKGEQLAEIGNYPSNGDWAPHLHFQLITELSDYHDGDYPAVCSDADRARFKTICPDPNLILQIPSL